jgi:hypothetical protein
VFAMPPPPRPASPMYCNSLDVSSTVGSTGLSISGLLVHCKAVVIRGSNTASDYNLRSKLLILFGCSIVESKALSTVSAFELVYTASCRFCCCVSGWQFQHL